jgi:peptide-methionine (S)-S-oxide reductase
MKSSSINTIYRSRILTGLFAASLLGFTAIFAIADPISSDNLQTEAGKTGEKEEDKKEQKLTTATFGSGCFWCTEAVFQRLKGVEKVVSGYMGGRTKNPTYEEVCTGLTGHAEVIQIQYDPAVISFAELLEAFWKTHDPTTLNRQGADTGTQYRSVVFFHTPEQKEEAEKYKTKLDEAKIFENKIVTEISPAKEFYPAEKYHQNYFNDNPNQGYCRAVIAPKVEKFEKVFKDRLKK